MSAAAIGTVEHKNNKRHMPRNLSSPSPIKKQNP